MAHATLHDDAAPSETTEQRLYELEAVVGGYDAVTHYVADEGQRREIADGLWSMIREQVKAVRAAHEAEAATTAAE